MRSTFKYFTLAGLGGLLCLFLAIPADAQRGGHGGGGGGSHGGGGGFHGGGGGGFHSGGGGGFSGARATAPQRSYNSAPQRTAQTNRTTVNRATNNTARSYSSAPTRSYSANGRTYASTGGRPYVAGTSRGYAGGRAYVGGGGRAYGAFGARGGYYYNRGFYGSLYYPRLGFRLGYLPYGYYPFWWGDYQYYYSGGYFYNYDNGQYTVVEPPVGAAINSLPSGAQPITINGQQYYELNGVYYLPITKDDGTVAYQVAGKDGQLDTTNSTVQQYDQGNNGQYNQGNTVPQGTHPVAKIGDMINQLPQDSRKVSINGETLYVTPDDVYLKATTDNNGNKAYTVVGTPTDQPPQD